MDSISPPPLRVLVCRPSLRVVSSWQNLCIGSLVTENDVQEEGKATGEGEAQPANATEREAGEDEEDAEVPGAEVERTVEGLEKVAAAGLDELARQDSVDT